MRLQMKVPGVWRSRNELDRARVAGIAHVDHADAVREEVPDIGEALFDHDLDGVRASALVAVADQLHVVRILRRFDIRHVRSLILIRRERTGAKRAPAAHA